jgi:hypothetical protein
MWSGGGIYFLNRDPEGSSQDLRLSNDIINDNSTSSGNEPNLNLDRVAASLVNCDTNTIMYMPDPSPLPIIGVGSDCEFNVSAAGLGPIMSMGGNRLPVLPLLRSSVAIDGSPEATSNPTEPVQQRDSWTRLDSPLAAWQTFQRDVDSNQNGTIVRDVGAFEYNNRWEAELLELQAKQGSAALTNELLSGYSRGAGRKFAATCAAGGESLTYVVPIHDLSSSWNIKVGVRKTPTSGKFQLAVANSSSGPWTNVSTERNTYSASSAFASFDLGSQFFQATGDKYFRFTVTGKGISTGSCNLSVDYIEVTQL